MQAYRLTADAKKDLIEIWNYTYDKWGDNQADNYLRKLESGFNKIAKGKIAGKRPLKAYPKLNSVHYEHHYIFFLKQDPPIILAILHEMMDLISKIKHRLGDG